MRSTAGDKGLEGQTTAWRVSRQVSTKKRSLRVRVAEQGGGERKKEGRETKWRTKEKY